MAETVRIEIPVSVQDKTDPSLSNITKKVNTLAKASEKVSKIMMGSGAKKSGIEKALEKQEKIMQKEHQIEITAQDHATPVLSEVEDRAAHVSGSSAEIEISAEDNATGVMGDVSDGAAALNGETSEVELSAEDNATETIGDVGDAAAALDGESSEIEIGAEDNATGVMNDVSDSAAALNGESAEVEVGAEDNATSVINDVSDAAAALDGTHVQVSVDAVDNASTALQNAAMGGARSAGSGLATAAGFAGLSLGIGSAINSFKDFEAGMSEVKAISGATEEQFASLTEKAKYMGATTKFTATEASEGLKYMAMAGWKPEQMEAGLEGIMNLAAASGESLGTTSDIVTDALTAFGMKAEQSTEFADILAEASSDSNTNVGIMGESFKYAAPLMGAMGYTAYDTATALGLMANAGIKGSMAGTTLRTAISNLAAPTKAMREGMEKYGISLTDETGKMKTLKGVMDNVRKSLSGLSEDEQAAAVKTIFGKQAMSGMLAIINTEADAYEELYENIQNSEGAAGRMKDIMLDNLQGDLTLLGSAWEGVQDTFGERISPHLRSMVEAITEAMPGLSSAINQAFDNIDPIIENFKTKVGNMLSSEEWKDANGLDKINIAWDTLIGDPFNEWINGDGRTLIGDGLKTLFSEASGVFSGEGGLTNWVSLGMVAIGTSKAATGISNITKAIQEFPGVSALMEITGITGPMLGAALAAGAAAVAIMAVVDSINNAKIEQNLADHFGTLELSAEDAAKLAEQTLQIEGITAELHVSTVKFNEAAKLQRQAEAKLKEVNVLQWRLQKVQVTLPPGSAMDPEDLKQLKSSAEELKKSLVEQLTAEEEGSESFVTAILGAQDASGVIETMQGWFTEDKGQVESLGKAIGEMLQDAINEGAESLETATAVSIMQAKMMDIVNGARLSELQGKLDWLDMNSSAAALTPESWSAYVGQVGAAISELVDLDANSYSSYLGRLREYEKGHPEREAEAAAIRQLIQEANDNVMSQYQLEGWGRMYGSLKQTYGNDISSAQENLKSAGENFKQDFQTLMEWAEKGYDYLPQDSLGERVMEHWSDMFYAGGLDKTTQGALMDRFTDMLPTVDAMSRYMDTFYDEQGKQISEIPKGIKDAYWEAMELGLMAGDEDSYKAMAAKYVADMFDTRGAFDQWMQDNGRTMDEFTGQFGDEFETYLNRAFAETKEGIDYGQLLEDIFTNISGKDVNWAEVESSLNEVGLSIADYLKEKGIDIGDGTAEVHGNFDPDFSEIASRIQMDGLNVVGGSSEEGTVTVTVAEGDSLWGIADRYGLNWNEISAHVLEDNDFITDPSMIEPDWEIKLRLSDLNIETETDGLGSQLSESLQSAIESSGSEAEVTAEGLKVTLGDVEVDDKSSAEQVAEAMGMTMDELASAAGVSTAELEAGAIITIPQENITMDTSAIQEATQAAADEAEPSDVEQTATANTTLEEGETDTSAVEAGVQEDLDDMDDWETDGESDVELSQTNNVDSIYSEIDGIITAKFAEGFTASAPVSIHLEYSIENPSANISLGGSASGSGTVTATVASANGRYVDGPLLSWVGEDGPEFIIPVGSKRKDRGIELWEQAGQALGIPGYADGGLVGGSVPLYSSGDDEIEGKEVSFADGVTPEVSGGNSGGVTVQVNLSPDFTLNDADESNILALIRANMKELADDLGGELAEKLSEAYENRPVA